MLFFFKILHIEDLEIFISGILFIISLREHPLLLLTYSHILFSYKNILEDPCGL